MSDDVLPCNHAHIYSMSAGASQYWGKDATAISAEMTVALNPHFHFF